MVELKKNSLYSEKAYFLLLFLLYLLHMLNLYIWLKIDTTPLVWDPNRHLMHSLQLFDALKTTPFNFLKIIVNTSGRYSFLAPLAVSPFYAILSPSSDAGVFINSAIFLPVLIYSTYALGELLFGRKEGLFAAFIISMYPMVVDQLKTFQPDLPLTAILTLSFYFLFKSEYFTNRKYCLLFGVSFGLGMLTKVNFIGFIILPLFYMLWAIFSDKNKNFARPKTYILSSILIAIMVSFIYYYNHLSWIAQIIEPRAGFQPHAILPLPGTLFFIKFLRSISWYAWALMGYQLSFFLFIMFVLGILFLRKATDIKKEVYIIFALWIVAPLLLLSYFRPLYCDYCSSSRYSLPILPAIAIITSAGILRINKKSSKFLLAVAITVYGFVQLLALSYGITKLPPRISIPLPAVRFFDKNKYWPDHLILFLQYIPAPRPIGNFYHPSKTNWYAKADEILDIIDKETKGGKATIAVIPDQPEVWGPLRLKAYIKKLPFTILCDGRYGYKPYFKKFKNIDSAVSELDFILDKEEGWMSEEYLLPFITEAKSLFKSHIDEFDLIDKVYLPDNSTMLIYRRKKE